MKVIKPYFIIETPINTSEIMKHLEKCGRVCYKSEDLITDESASKFIKAIISSGHESVVEHFSITVRFVTNRGVTHEMVRHRLASYSQESTRYCSYNKDKFDNQLTFIKPCWVDDGVLGTFDINWLGVYGKEVLDITKIDKSAHRWFWSCANVEREYFALLREGWTPERAREILNNSLKTEIMMTCDLREWRTVFKQRCSREAHPEIRESMIPLLKEFQEKMPILFGDIEYYKGE